MTNKLEILYPTKKDLYTTDWTVNPQIHNHFTFFNSQIVLTTNRTYFSVRSMNYKPSFVTCEYEQIAGKEWFEFFKSKDYYTCCYIFQKACKDLIELQNKVYLSKVFKREQLYKEDLPKPVMDVVEVFNP